MTILHKFMQSADEVAVAIQKYFISLDPNDLAVAVDLLKKQTVELVTETQTPSIQPSTIQLTDLTASELEYRFREDNALVLTNREYLADGAIEVRKFIRVLAKDQPEESVFLAKVTHVTSAEIVLSPVVPQTQ